MSRSSWYGNHKLCSSSYPWNFFKKSICERSFTSPLWSMTASTSNSVNTSRIAASLGVVWRGLKWYGCSLLRCTSSSLPSIRLVSRYLSPSLLCTLKGPRRFGSSLLGALPLTRADGWYSTRTIFSDFVSRTSGISVCHMLLILVFLG